VYGSFATTRAFRQWRIHIEFVSYTSQLPRSGQKTGVGIRIAASDKEYDKMRAAGMFEDSAAFDAIVF
jgi:hypothetical protein